MTKTFKLTHDLTCPELAGYKLPQIERNPIAIEVEMVQKSINGSIPVGQDWECVPATNPDGTVKGRWVYE